MGIKVTTENFIERSKAIHGNRYDYSLAEYTGSTNKVKIICPEHGVFEKNPYSHMGGYGCSKCGYKTKPRYDTNGFIKKALSKHGDKYDYSLVNYIDSRTKVKIICSKHGIFDQNPVSHLRGQECPSCGREKAHKSITHTTEKFVKKAKEVHGDKYDYSKVNYKRNDESVKIICPIHGEFEQLPVSHLNSYGCAQCGLTQKAKSRKITKEDFLERAKKTHNNRYKYYLSGNERLSDMITVECSDHGCFNQNMNNHLRGSGCPQCKNVLSSKRLTNTREDFIKSAKAVHGDKYDYSKVDYKNSKKNVTIICSIHGDFEQTPNNHLRCNGCLKCGAEDTGRKNRKSLDHFIKKSHEVHDYKYDYSKTKYVDTKTKVTIICPIHGEFKQSPFNHYVSGCKKCSSNGRSTQEDDIIDHINSILDDCVIDTNVRSIAKPYELDIVLPDLKVAIEFNGIYWHCEKHKAGKTYHKKKLELCKKHDYKLLTIFEDEWNDKNELMKDMIDKLIFGRNLTLDTLLNNFHYEYEVKQCLGEIEVICDRRFTNGEELETLGFTFIKNLGPDYSYFIDNRRVSKGMLKYEDIEKLSYYKIWDCGYNVYKYKHNGLWTSE